MEFESIRVLRDISVYPPQDFEAGDIVKIFTKDSYSSYIGKIAYIDIEWLEVDCSTQYKSDIRQFKFKDIDILEKFTEKTK